MLRGRRRTSSVCVAGVALGDIDRQWHLWHWAASGGALGDAAPFCVASVALGDIDLHSVWQALCLVTSTCTSIFCGKRLTWLCGRCGTWWHRPAPLCGMLGGRGTCWPRPSLCIPAVALGASTFILCGRRGTCGAGLALVARLVPGDAGDAAPFCVSCMALGHRPSLCVSGVALGDIDLHIQLCHTQLLHTQHCHTQLFHTHVILWHTSLWHTAILSLTTPSHHLSGSCLFCFLPFPSHFHICLVIIERSWHVGFSCPYFFLPSTALALGADVLQFGESGDFGGIGTKGQGQQRKGRVPKSSIYSWVRLCETVFQMRRWWGGTGRSGKSDDKW